MNHLILAAITMLHAVPGANRPCTVVPCPADLSAVELLLTEADTREWITVTEEGRSAGDRPLYAVHLDRGGDAEKWRVLLVGQQHGDEHAGKDALLHLIARVARDAHALPQDVDLWVVPMANPDGAEADRRRNDAGADLNRDHLLLGQPETRMLHALARRIQPHVVVDCHEFDRTSAAYRELGWDEWPLIMMDTANHPLLPTGVYEAGLAWVDAVTAPMAEAGFEYQRYLVGGPPPWFELRPSTLDGDDARNGLALAAGSLGFIIESGFRRAAEDPQADIGRRVAAYLKLLESLIFDMDLRATGLAAVAAVGATNPPSFLPVNTFWGANRTPGGRIHVVDRETGEPLEVPAPNLMTDRIFKRAVPTPSGYVVDSLVAGPYLELLERHGMPFEVLDGPRVMTVQRCELDRVEADFDPVHSRYGGRQIVDCASAAERTFAAGSLVVPLEGHSWRTVAALLEPNQLYGLYQYGEFRDTVADDGTIPVWRIASTQEEIF
jgi:hypothetical protein